MKARASVVPPVPRALSRRPRLARPPFPLADERAILVDGGGALAAAVALVHARAKGPVLVPPATASSLPGGGAGLRVYRVDDSLAPDEEDVEAAADGAAAMVLVHALGFPQDSARWRRFCDEHRLLLVEDCSAAWFATEGVRPVGCDADVAVFDAYEVLGLRAGVLRLSAALRAEGEPEAARPDPRTAHRLEALADPAVAGRRRAHYEALLERLGDACPPAFASLPDGASPLVFPLQVDEAARGRLLADRTVEAVPLPPLSGKPAVGLPVHQELDPADVARIASAAGARPAGTDVSVEVVDRIDGLEADWERLALECGNVYASTEWFAAWRDHLSTGKVRVAICRAGDRVLSLIPLEVVESRGLRTVTLAGHGPADQLSLLCAPGDRNRAATALRDALRQLDAWDVFVGEHLVADAGWSARLGARVLRRTSSPAVRSPGDWDAFLATIGRHARERIRANERRLGREHEVGFRLTADPAELEADLEQLRRLHLARWPDGTVFTEQWDFHADFARRAFRRGWLRLWFLELDGEAVAASYGFRFADVEVGYQVGRLPDLGQLQVGAVMLTQVVRAALGDGLREVRLGRGDSDYKYRFATEDTGLETVGIGRGFVGRTVLEARSTLRAQRRKLKTLTRTATAAAGTLRPVVSR